MIPGVLVTGNIVIDLLVHPVDEITWGGTQWVQSITQSLGGNGANTSAALGKLGVPVRLLGAVGYDAFGDDALERLRKCGVDTSFIKRMKESTATTVALVRSDGTRGFLHQPGVSRLVFAESAEFSAGGFTHFHIGNPFAMAHLRSQAPRMLAAARALGMRTSLDMAWDALGEWAAVVEPCLPHTDLVFCNEDEARMLAGADEPARYFRSRGAGSVVLKLGERGCALFSAAGDFVVEGFKVPVVDTTGAGDCFAGAFIASLQRGLPMERAARIANAVGALNVQALGATSGLLDWDSTLRWMS